jgi:hypothetical protein
LDKAAPFNPGFPAAFFGNDPHFLPEGKPNSALVNAVSLAFCCTTLAERVQSGHIKFVNHP